MRKQVSLKDQLWEQLCSVGAVLMSMVALIILLYLITIIIRFIAAMMA
jgi:hypothetical protein